VTESGPDHDKRFEAYAVVSDERYGPGHGLNKKQAEQEAAASAFTDLTTLRDSQQSAVAGGSVPELPRSRPYVRVSPD